MYWLSHHPPDEYDRCYRIAGVHVCARCLGTYPLMFAAIAVQLGLHFPLEHPLDVPAVIASTLPATIDWAIGRMVRRGPSRAQAADQQAGRFRPHRFSNAWRTATGMLLGLALGRTLFIHLQHPFPPVLLAQGGLVILVALPVFFMSYGRKGDR